MSVLILESIYLRKYHNFGLGYPGWDKIALKVPYLDREQTLDGLVWHISNPGREIITQNLPDLDSKQRG